MDKIEPKASLLVHNTMLNLTGQIIPLIAAIVSMPYVIKGLGVERFGILSLAQIIIGYFSLFDFGLGRATTKFVADALGKREMERIPSIIWTSFTSQAVLGITGGVVLVLLSIFFVETVLNIPNYLLREVKEAFIILSLSVPIIICTLTLRGVLEAAQRFDLVNLVKVPSSTMIFLLPALGVYLNYTLSGIISLLLVCWILTLLSYLFICFKIYPLLGKELFSVNKNLLRPLFTFGGWILICNMLIPILNNIDKFMIGALISVKAVSYYSAPYEVVSRLQIFPYSLVLSLFPVFASLSISSKPEVERIFAQSLKYLLIAVGTIVLIIICFSENILNIWLGSDFAQESSLVLQILSVGFLFNALAQIPANYLDSIGRPDIRAKIFLSYIPFYIFLAWSLIVKYGIVGAASAWTLRASLELILFFIVSLRIKKIDFAVFVENKVIKGVMIYGGFALFLLLSFTWLNNLLIQGVVFTIWIIFFSLLSWRYLLDSSERQAILLLTRKYI